MVSPEEGRSILRDLYEWVLSWSGSPWAVLALFVLAFAESSFFPVPPDVLLMALAMGAVRAGLAAQSFWFALVCSVGSVLGGCFGYGLGVFARPAVVEPLVRWLRWQRHFERAREMYERYDVWAVAIAGFTPIPYKIFTIAGGIARIDFLRFVLASAASRSARFFLVAGFLFFFGGAVEPFIKEYFELLTLLFTVLLVGGFLAMRLLWRRKRRSA